MNNEIKYRWEALLKRLPKTKLKRIKIIEVGVWTGTMSTKLLEGNKKIRLIQVDRWKAYNKVEKKHEGKTAFSCKRQETFDKAKLKNIKRMTKFGKRVKIIEADSLIAAKCIKNKCADIVFLDAAHNYYGCKADIQAYVKKVKAGGWIGGHDYPNRKGVKKSVDEMFGEHVETDIDKTWWVKL